MVKIFMKTFAYTLLLGIIGVGAYHLATAADNNQQTEPIVSENVQTHYYFNVLASQNVGPGNCNLSNSTIEPFLTDEEGTTMPPTSSPGTACNPGGDYCCVLAFAEEDIELVEIATDVWAWQPKPGSTPASFEKRNDEPSRLK